MHLSHSFFKHYCMKLALFGASKPEACQRIKQILASLNDIEVVDGDVSFEGADMALSIGGDGTFLRTAAKIGSAGLPILGVNAGRLGFLADVPLDEAEQLLPVMLTEGKYAIEQRTVMALSIPDCRQPYPHFALNEVAILKRDVSSMVSVSVSVDGVLLNQYDADGLAIATPTGSTAYAMSAGGPILDPQSHCFELVAIAPHSLTTRPLVIPDTCTLDITVASRNNLFLVAIDGTPLHLTTQYSLQITKAAHNVAVVRRPERIFFDTLRQKLMWGVRNEGM